VTEQQLNEEQINASLLAGLITMMATSAFQCMGKTINPMTNKTEVDLPGAQASIDMLEMLRAKTKGNLSEQEKHMLDETISMLQMNYVQTVNSQPADSATEDSTQQPEAAEPKDSTEDETKQESDDTAPGQPPKDQKDPKYHKSYG